MKTSIVVVLIVVIGGGGALLIRNASSGDGGDALSDDVLYTVQSGKLTVTVIENGSLMAKNSEKINFQGRRGGKITYLIDEGKTVEAEEVLCRLETTELETQLQELKLSIVQTEADLNTAQTELDIQKSENVATIEKARIALTKAEKELEKYRDGDAPKERRNFEIAIKEAETKHSRSKKKYEDSVKLLEQDYINKSQVEQDQIEFERAEIQLDGAQRDLELFEKYTFPMTMTDKETAVSDAQRALANADKRAESTLRQKEVAVESKDQRLTTLQKKLKEVEEEIEKSTIKSPSPGIVIYGDPSEPWYRERIQLGNQVWGGFTLFTIPDLRVMQVQVHVHEADINKIKEDQVVTVTMDTYTGLVLHGKVTKIATIAGEPGQRRDEEVKKFTVDITLDSTEGLTLKPGISAKAEIFIEEKEDVLSVPLQCVFIEEGTHYCYRAGNGGGPLRTAVKTGLSNDSCIEIIEGLDQGDRVLLYNPALAAQATGPAEEDQTQAATTQNASQP
jgi:HlyD family secretion protein